MPDWHKHLESALANEQLDAARVAEVREEIAQHLDDRYHTLLANGLTLADAEQKVLGELQQGELGAQLRHVLRPAPEVILDRDKSNHRSPLILSVDDDRAILATRQAMLECEGYAVLSAADGEQALSFFIANQIDLVLLDYVMPGMNGGVVCQEMKKVKPDVPVIMVSANLVDGDTLKRVDKFISKGESPRILLEKVREHLTRCVAPATSIELEKRSRASH